MIVGRAAELERLRGLLDQARQGRSTAVLIEGEAGVGKSTLLAATAELASGFVQLRASGYESETRLDHAALLEVLNPLRENLLEVPPGQAAALAAALGWAGPVGADPAADRPPGDRFLVGAGTLTLLALAAQHTPVLVLVDDLQWVDRESAQALLFAARRLTSDPVAFVFAGRPEGAGEPSGSAWLAGIDRLHLAGLTTADVAALLPDLATGVASELAAGTGGNPLALLESAAILSPAQRAGAAPLPDPLPVGARLRDAYGQRLIGLSPAARRAVLLLAASRDDNEGTVAEAVRAAGFHPAEAIDEAEAAGIIHTGPGTLELRHPLLRAVAWRLATPAERREVHRGLAAGLPAGSPERLWHLAAATSGRDDTLAARLVEAAAAMRSRRGYAAASATLERAAALTTDPAQAAAHLAAALDDAILAGDTERARALGQRVLDPATGATPAAQASARYGLGFLEEYAGSVVRAAELQQAAAELAEGRLRVRALFQVAVLCYRLDDPAGMRRAADALASTADFDDPEQRMLAAYSLGAAHVFGGDQAYGQRQMREAMALLESEPALRDDPRHLILALVVGRWLSDLGVMAASAERRLARARELGAFGVLVPALSILAAGRSLLGDHTGAYADAGEAVELGENLGHTAELALAYTVLAWEAAARTLAGDAQRALTQARRLAERAGVAEVAEHLLLVEAFCAETRGDLAAVVAGLEPRLAASAGRSGHAGDALPVAPLLVEAYLGLRRPADAAALAQRYAAANPAPRGAPVEALVQRCAGLVAPDAATAAGHFEAALAAAAAGPTDPFEAARTRLLYGARLRRGGQRIAAREQLRAARAAFAAADLTLWVARTAEELAATGESAWRRRPATAEPLTSQETRVARLVARGLTNREVAAALFLSPKTVEHHIGSVFRKRGLRSRTELARWFAQLEPGG